jgi:phage terminase small subunit
MARSARSVSALPADAGPGTPTPTAQQPEWLGDKARAVWDRLAPGVDKTRLTASTAEAFALLCVSLAAYADADELLRDGSLLTGDGPVLVQHPAVA